MPGTDLEVRSERTLAIIDSGEFAERVEPLLPDTIPVRRFVQLAKTAIRTRPELAAADDRTLFNALIRCAQDGLYPDGREAALNVYRTKVKDGDSEVWVQAVQYLPMIGGLRKNLAEYGWTLKTRVVFANDEFSYTEEPQTIRHVPVRPGGDRGDRIAAYAVATHRDGRRLQIVLDANEIAKRRAKAKTDKIWSEWPDAMWEKSAGHAIFDEIPKSERDRMRVPADELEPGEAVDLLYGPDGTTFAATPAPPEAAEPSDPPREGPGTNGSFQETAAGDPPAAAPGDHDDDPEPQPTQKVDHGETVVPIGVYQDMTLRSVAELGEDGEKWLTWAYRNKSRFDTDFASALVAFVDDQLKAAAA